MNPEDDNPPAKDERTFTAAEVEAKIKARLKKSDTENARLTKQAEGHSKSLEDLTAKFDKLQEKHDASSKSDIEKEHARLLRQFAKIESERDGAVTAKTEAELLAAAAVAGLQETRLKATVREALRGSKAHAQGMGQAVDLMVGAGAGLDEEGNFQMTIDDVPFDKPAEAAAKWLEKNTHFQEGSGGGSGSPRPGGNTRLLNNDAMKGMSPQQLVSEGLKASPS